jgi:hypothetical protein
LNELCPGAQYTVRGYTLDDVEWNSPDIPKPTQDVFETKFQEVVDKQLAKNTWMPQRIASYPPLQAQLDMLYWDQVNGTTVWKNMITDIKKRFPKDN